MIIHNNLAAIQSVNQLNKNNKSEAKAANQLATGEKFSGAGNDKSSEYSISEKMRVQIRALDQCTSNTTKGRNMLDVASQAVEQQVEIMKKIRTITMKASDGVYSNADRKILQEEVNQLLDESEELAQTTNFNGIPLLNKSTKSRTDQWFDAYAPYRPIPSTIPVMPEAAASPTGEWTVPQGSYGAITATPGLSNVFDASRVVKGSAFSAMPTAGTVIFDSSGNQDTVQVNAVTGALEFSNGLPIVVDVANPANTNVFVPTHPPLTSPPAVGSHVAKSAQATMSGTTINTPTYEVKNAPGSGILSYFDTTQGSISVAPLGFDDLITQLTAQGKAIPEDLDQLGFSLDCGDCDQFFTILFDDGTDVSKWYGDDPRNGGTDPVCYSIGVASVTDSDSLMQAVFNGISAASGMGGATLPSTTDVSIKVDNRHDIKINYHAATGEFTISKDGPAIKYLNGIKGAMIEDNFYRPEQHLSLQTGTESSQYLNTHVPNTTLDALFPPADIPWDTDPTAADFPIPWPNEYEWNQKENRPMTEAEKKLKWTEEVWKYPSRRVNLEDDKCVSTQAKAARFIDDVDQALHYLITVSTELGAQSNRLNYTEDNLVTAAENTTASDSTIRDANMGAAVLEKAKTGLLSQASQAMLTQANQSMQSVMELLQ